MTNLLKKFLKISIIAIIILICYRIWIFFINANNNSTKNLPNNKNMYKNISASEISKTWVAISTNLWIKYSQKTNISQTFYQEIFSIEEFKNNPKNVEKAIIEKHMIAIKEYDSLMKTDFKVLLQGSHDKKKTLEWIYKQLTLRFSTTVESIKILENQKSILISEFDNLENQIKNTKTKINSDYKKIDADEVNDGITNLLRLRTEQNYVKTYIVFINNFLKNYYELNNFNWNLINSLKINKNAIENGTYVVLPKNWDNFLKEYGLLYTEEEYQNIIKKEEAEK